MQSAGRAITEVEPPGTPSTVRLDRHWAGGRGHSDSRFRWEGQRGPRSWRFVGHQRLSQLNAPSLSRRDGGGQRRAHSVRWVHSARGDWLWDWGRRRGDGRESKGRGASGSGSDSRTGSSVGIGTGIGTGIVTVTGIGIGIGRGPRRRLLVAVATVAQQAVGALEESATSGGRWTERGGR